jgi:ankyrin repeat protein
MNKLTYLIFTILILITCVAKTTAIEPSTKSTQLTQKIWEDIFKATNNVRGWPALHYALYNDNFEAAEWLADKYPETIFLTTPNIKVMGWTDLTSDYRRDHHVCHGEVEPGFDTLELALMKNQTALALKFLQDDYKLDINSQKQRYTGSYIDAWYQEIGSMPYKYIWVSEWVKEIGNGITYNYMVNHPIKTSTPLYWAILASDLRPLDILLSKNVNFKNIYAETFLGNAYYKINDFSLDALDVAAAWGSDEALKIIITHMSSEKDISDETIQVFRKYGQTPREGSLLLKAIQANDVKGFQILLDHGADPYSTVIAHNKTLFSHALDNPNRVYADILRTLFPTQAYLLDAIRKDRLDVLNDLIAYGLGNSETLHEAISSDKIDAAALLIADGQLDAKAVEMIIYKDFDELFMEILRIGYPLSNIQSKVIEKNAINISTLLLDQGNNFSRENLSQCVQLGRLNIIKLCKDKNIISSEDKEFLLVKAIEHNQYEIFDYLLGL